MTPSSPRTLLWLVLAAALGLPIPGAAQEAAAEEECLCPDDLRDALQRSVAAFGPRARLGVVLGEPTEVSGRTGVALAEVPERSPAHEAGIRAGDVVVAIDGDPLGENPRRTLLEAMADRTPGDRVTVTFYRGGAERTLAVETEEGPTRLFRGVGRPPFPPEMAPRIERIRADLHGLGLHRGLLREVELVGVSPELGEFFGAERGVLVARIDADSPLNLRTGDVILAIGGRDVRDTRHARAILASYQPDEEIAFTVVRDRRERTVTGRRPDRTR